MKVTVKSLEQRLTQKTTEVEHLNQVKIENEQVLKENSVQKQQLNTAVKDIDYLKKALDESQDKLKAAKEKAKAHGATESLVSDGLAAPGAQGGPSDGGSLFRKMRKGEKSSRASRTSNYF